MTPAAITIGWLASVLAKSEHVARDSLDDARGVADGCGAEDASVIHAALGTIDMCQRDDDRGVQLTDRTSQEARAVAAALRVSAAPSRGYTPAVAHLLGELWDARELGAGVSHDVVTRARGLMRSRTDMRSYVAQLLSSASAKAAS